jgi:CubicO group peptidase (beta-lactamase class C family)
MRSRSVAAILLLALAAACVQGNDQIEPLRSYLDALAANRGFNGSVLVADSGRTVFEESYGYADLDRAIPNTPRTRFPIASVSKALTAVGVLRLAELGGIRLDDPVATYLSGFPYGAVTVRHLLSHTSGLPPYNAYFDSLRAAEPDRVFTNADYLPVVIGDPVPLLFEPGERVMYNNVNYLVAALVIEAVTGRSYGEYMDERVLRPAGMGDTEIILLSDLIRVPDRPNFAHQYIYPTAYASRPIRSLGIPYVAEYWTAYEFEGFGEYASTLDDLIRFDRALAEGRLLADSTREVAYSPVTLNDGRPNAAGFGLGWMVASDTTLGTVVYHSGASVGLSVVLIQNVTTGRAVVVYDTAHDNAYAVGMNVLKILGGQTVPRPKQSLAVAYGRLMDAAGPDEARRAVAAMIRDTATYAIDEDEINRLGYDFMATNDPYRIGLEPRYESALEVFRLNVELFPESWNVYDSYGEALLALGRREEAIAMYRRSLE